MLEDGAVDDEGRVNDGGDDGTVDDESRVNDGDHESEDDYSLLDSDDGGAEAPPYVAPQPASQRAGADDEGASFLFAN